MTNVEIEVALINKFGLDATIKYCEMVSYAYTLMHDEVSDSEYDEFDYGYDAMWWKNKAAELKERQTIKFRV